MSDYGRSVPGLKATTGVTSGYRREKQGNMQVKLGSMWVMWESILETRGIPVRWENILVRMGTFGQVKLASNVEKQG
jgi:hypothetical protein